MSKKNKSQKAAIAVLESLLKSYEESIRVKAAELLLIYTRKEDW